MRTSITLLAIIPGMMRGHIVALLRDSAGSGFYDHDDPEVSLLNDRLVDEARRSYQLGETFSHGPLTGQLVSSAPVIIQAFNLAPKLVIADHHGASIIQEESHFFLERVFTSFVIDSQTRLEIMDAMDLVGGNPATARTFTDTYYGLPGVVVLE